MSRIDRSSPKLQNAPDRRSGPAAVGAAAVAALALLIGSGLLRAQQVRRVEATISTGRTEGKFDLSTIPLDLGDWHGAATKLDDQIVRATGSDDLTTRRYVDRRTGVALDVIVLYGPTSEIFIHSPQLCYPKAGFDSQGDVVDRAIDCGGTPAVFRSVAYAKGDPGSREIQDVYFSWRYNGSWTPVLGVPRQLERIPGMYKVQVARRITPNEVHGSAADPIESFLRVLIPDLESRIQVKAAAGAP
jgi:hypothetical protein